MNDYPREIAVFPKADEPIRQKFILKAKELRLSRSWIIVKLISLFVAGKFDKYFK